MNLGALLLVLLDGLVIKGAVMALCAWLLVRVWRVTRAAGAASGWAARSRQERDELRWLLGSLSLFALSEGACTADVIAGGGTASAVLDGVHAVSSAAALGLFGVWLFAFVDRRLLRFGGAGCLVNRVCAGCTVATPAGCRMRDILSLAALFLAAAAAPALLVPTGRMEPDAGRLALPWASSNAWWDGVVVPWIQARAPGADLALARCAVPSSTLVLEMRVLPGAAMAVSLAALALVRARREVLGLRVMGFAAGVLGYTLLELAGYATRAPIFGSLWHELAELWFLVATIELLRRGLGRRAGGGA